MNERGHGAPMQRFEGRRAQERTRRGLLEPDVALDLSHEHLDRHLRGDGCGRARTAARRRGRRMAQSMSAPPRARPPLRRRVANEEVFGNRGEPLVDRGRQRRLLAVGRPARARKTPGRRPQGRTRSCTAPSGTSPCRRSPFCTVDSSIGAISTSPSFSREVARPVPAEPRDLTGCQATTAILSGRLTARDGSATMPASRRSPDRT